MEQQKYTVYWYQYLPIRLYRICNKHLSPSKLFRPLKKGKIGNLGLFLMSCTRWGAAKSSGTGGRGVVAAISRVARRAAAARPAPRPSRRLWLTITTQGPCTSQKWHSALNVDMAAATPLRLKICLAGQRLHLSKSDGTGRSGRRPFSWGEASRIQADAAPTCWLLK